MEALRKLVHEYKSNCDHTKNNLTMQISQINGELGRTRSAIDRLESSVPEKLNKINESICLMQVALATNSANHKNNGALIKWLMGITSALFVGALLALIGFTLKR